MDHWLDTARPPREGEGLDLKKLEPYLRRHLPQIEAPLLLEQFPCGHSNLTYLLRAGKFEMVLRRPPFGNRVKSAHDMGREYKVLSGLSPAYAPAPQPFLFCEDESVLGAPFYVMERRRGMVLRRKLPKGLELSPAQVEKLCKSFIDNLATLHTLDYDDLGLGDLGKPTGYVERQVTGWSKRYEKAATHPWAEMEQVAKWLTKNQPVERAAGIIHNDYKYDNLLLDPVDPTRIVAVLDWEMSTLGDPLMDLGTTLAYWIEKADPPHFQAAAFGPSTLPGSFTRRQLAERYAKHTGFEIPHLTFYFAFGLFKLAAILQQIYYRYANGLTQDERFAQFPQMVGLLGRMAAEAVEQDRV
jgi:aminoglycoside phosphotransferase (APT) family kinase protein